LIYQGITYTLTEVATSNPLVDSFTLGISGINGTADTEGGRYGVQSFAFTQPPNFSTANAPVGFTYQSGGLNSSGCNGKGNHLCFAADTTPTGPVLASNSSLSYTFGETLSSGTFAEYNPDFAIKWVGTQNNYNLVSKTLDASSGGSVPVPEPGSLLLLGTGLLALGLVIRKRQKRA
jgi:hypothetical protein